MPHRKPDLTIDLYLAWPAQLGPPGTLEWTLDAAERARLAGFAFAEDRLQYAAAHALLRQALSLRVGRPARNLTFTAGPDGRPTLVGPRSPGFSLARRRSLVACAVGPAAVGIDVEDAHRPLEGRAEAALTPAEQEHLLHLPEAGRPGALLALWTLKQAWLKAHGASAPAGPVEVLGLARAAPGWTVGTFEADARHRLAFTAQGPGPVRCWAARVEGASWRFEPLVLPGV